MLELSLDQEKASMALYYYYAMDGTRLLSSMHTTTYSYLCLKFPTSPIGD